MTIATARHEGGKMNSHDKLRREVICHQVATDESRADWQYIIGLDGDAPSLTSDVVMAHYRSRSPNKSGVSSPLMSAPRGWNC